MSWTKRQYIVQAFEEIGLASYVYDLQPEQLQSAARRLDAMMAMWNGRGIRLGYPIPSSPEDTDLDQETGVPDSANEAVYLNLGVKLGPGFGKAVPMETKVAAKDAYNVVLARATKPPVMQLPKTMIRGAGQKPWRFNSDPFIDPPTDPLKAGDDSVLDFE